MSTSSILLGIGATMLSNSFYLSSSFFIKEKNVVPGEITVFSAVVRTLIFGSWAAKVKCQQIGDQNQDQTGFSKRSWLFLIMGNLAIAVTILLSYISVQMMPLSDFIVFAFISPVFTLIFAMVKNRSKVTFINISLCLMIVVGVGLVAQPAFIFGNTLAYQLDSTERETYALGVFLSILNSVIMGFCPILQANCKDMPMAYFMMWSGIAKMAIGLLCPVMGLPNNLLNPSKFVEDIGVLSLVALCSMLGLVFMQAAVKLSSNPLLVSITRSMEIVMALFVDMMTISENYHEMHIWYKIMGALIVMGCVVGISLSDMIEEKMSGLCRQTRRGYTVLDEEAERMGEEVQANNSSSSYGTSQPGG